MKKTEDLNAYHKEYRNANRDHIRSMEKARYYKTKGLTDEEIKTFGDCSADYFKLKQIWQSIKERNPALNDILLKQLVGEEEPNI
jgi:hypothetical protein